MSAGEHCPWQRGEQCLDALQSHRTDRWMRSEVAARGESLSMSLLQPVFSPGRWGARTSLPAQVLVWSGQGALLRSAQR